MTRISARKTPGTGALGAASIVGALMSWGVPAGNAARAEQPPAQAEIIFHGGPIVTLEKDRCGVEALAVADGKILALGARSDIEKLRNDRTRTIDLRGQALLPAFVDHHAHLLNVGLALAPAAENHGLLDVGAADTLADLAVMIREQAARQPAGSWILGYGWSQAKWGAEPLPDREVLDAAAPQHPVFLTRVDGHAGWANQLALQRAGLGPDSPDPPGGAIVRGANGRLTGVLLERANEAVLRTLPPWPQPEMERAFQRAAHAFAARGVTVVYDAGFLAPPGVVDLDLDYERYLEALVRVDAEAPLPVQVRLMIPAPGRFAEHVLAQPAEARMLSPRLQITHLKLFADGALGSRGAALSHPFADDPSTQGVLRMESGDIQALASAALRAGLDVATHAIGDRAIAHTLDAYERLLEKDSALDPRRLRIEHFSYPRAGDMKRAARLGVVLSIQPNFVLPGDDGVTMEDQRVGKAHAGRVYAWGSLDRLGPRLAGGSDYFTKPGPPLLDFYMAVTRQNAAGRPAGGWHPDERLSQRRALELFTTLYAPGGGQPETGLRPGRPADMVILSGNPLETAPGRTRELLVLATLRHGVFTYDIRDRAP